MRLFATKKVDSLLQSAKLRKTGQRKAVLTALLRAHKPQTTEQIHLKLGKGGPNKVTVYRILESFVETGLVHKAFLRQRTWYFELADNCTESQCHPHFTCTDCGQTHCLFDMSLPMAKSPHKGFVINHQRVQLEGLCPHCSSSR